MADPCPDCRSRLRAEPTIDVLGDEVIVSICWRCGYSFDVVVVLGEDGRETTNAYAEDALGEAQGLWQHLSPRSTWLRRMRDQACLRWSASADLRYLQMARKLERARRRAIEPLRLVEDPDRVELGPAAVELLHILRAEVTIRGEGLARRFVVARRSVRVPGGLGLHVATPGGTSRDLNDAILEAARQDGVWETYGTTEAPDQGREQAPQGGGDGPAALGNAGEDGAA